MKQLRTIKKQLEERLKELGARVEDIEDDLRTPRSAGWEDRATEIEGDEVLDALEETAHAEIGEILAALRRIEDGTYATCARCGEKINEKRLEALPYAIECIQCAESGRPD
ncbi:MAG: TraR/DksA family transcriptional regulator [Rhodospirillaceae bacterium]|jgi:DnaK suppressor protein|nr:TraR/DksA family transcriptional regulator [Rhodospirillaceae bacterium]MBT5456580.1 TraR/DksA family transcriptional regulator [Rhodospirillaceae bacterium]